MLNPNTLSSGSSNPTPNLSELGRKKSQRLAKGYSLMDWIRLCKSNPDLGGSHGVMRQITYEELARHNREDDCWTAIEGKVYNVTPYMKYHPGGVEEIMRGAGINATKLFNDVHPWVNLQNMMEKCLLGGLVGVDPLKSVDSSQLSLSTQSLKLLKVSDNLLKVVDSKPELTFDSYQTMTSVTLIVYTKWKLMQSDYITVDVISSMESDLKKADTSLVLFIYLKDQVFKFSNEILPVKNDYQIKVSKEGKVELTLSKQLITNWNNIGSSLKYVLETVTDDVRCGVNYHVCELTSKKRVTHDTDIYIFTLPQSTRMCVPLGYHIFLKFFNGQDKYLIKPYTIASDTMLDDKINADGRRICLMIKSYEDGLFTSKLKNIMVGSKMSISNFAGNFVPSKLMGCKSLVLLAAGSGFTPMIRVMTKAVELENIKNVILLFFNKDIADIIWSNELEEFRSKYANKVTITHILSQPKEGSGWTGERGRVSDELFKRLVVAQDEPFFCLCGPKGFTNLAVEILEKNGFTKESRHVFLG